MNKSIYRIPIYRPSINNEEIKNVVKCVKSGWISSSGKYVDDFASEFAKYIGVKYALPVSTGTASLHLSLLSLDIKEGDEIIIPALTFASTANAVLYLKAKPVFIDVTEDTYSLNPKEIEKKITPKTKAIIIVHLYGVPVDMEPMIKIAKKYNLHLIEDTAEALGGEYKGKKLGSIGEIGCFSFYANKIITTGEGGMLVTNSKSIYDKSKYYRDHAMSRIKKRYWHLKVGYNYPMTAMQAAFGSAQLKKINIFLKKKKSISKKYHDGLKSIKNLKLMSEPNYGKASWWLYTIFCINKKERDNLMFFLVKKGIETRQVFYPLPTMPPYKDNKKYKVANLLSNTGLNLPSYPDLKSIEIKYIVNCIRTFFNDN